MKTIPLGDVSLNVIDEGKGRPLLLVHGFPLSQAMWRKQVEVLSPRCRTIVPDLRGFGSSGVTPGTVTMKQFADDLATLLDALDVNEPVDLCGLSMGGYIAWEFWRRHRKRLNRLILCDTRAVADTPDAASGRNALAVKVLAEGSQVAAEAMLPKLFAKATPTSQHEIVEATRQVMLSAEPQGVAAALRGMAAREDFSAILPKIDVKTLVLVGEEDVISTVKEMKSIAEAIPGALFVEIKGAGHMAPLEQPALVNEAITIFLD